MYLRMFMFKLTSYQKIGFKMVWTVPSNLASQKSLDNDAFLGPAPDSYLNKIVQNTVRKYL